MKNKQLPAPKSTKTSTGKMTLEEYQKKYTHYSNTKNAKLFLGILIAAIGVLLFFCLFSFTMRIFELELPSNINIYAGIAAAVISVLLYIFLFIVPIVKVFKLDYFVTNVNVATAREAQKHNRKVRHNLADKIIDATTKVDDVSWYDPEIVGKLAIAQKVHDEEGLKENLSALYNGCVKKSARSMITKAALKTGALSALSQSSSLDTALVTLVNFQLVKDLMFLYGFRPSDAKLVKIFGKIFRNSLVACGLGSAKIGSTVAQTVSESVKVLPIVGALISTGVDAAVQGITNSILTADVGRKTKKYLCDEYHLQDVLDGVAIEDTDEEFAETCKELEQELKTNKFAKAS